MSDADQIAQQDDSQAHAAGDITPGEQELYRRFATLAIAYETRRHPPLFTVEESRRLRGQMDGAHIKNLFLRDRKKRLWLVTVLEDRELDLKALRRRLGGQGSLSFGDRDLLDTVLGVSPGAVTPFAVLNDRAHQVTVVLDRGLFGHGMVNAHPLRNDRTTRVTPDGLMQFLRASGHEPLIVDFEAPDQADANPQP